MNCDPERKPGEGDEKRESPWHRAIGPAQCQLRKRNGPIYLFYGPKKEEDIRRPKRTSAHRENARYARWPVQPCLWAVTRWQHVLRLTQQADQRARELVGVSALLWESVQCSTVYRSVECWKRRSCFVHSLNEWKQNVKPQKERG